MRSIRNSPYLILVAWALAASLVVALGPSPDVLAGAFGVALLPALAWTRDAGDGPRLPRALVAQGGWVGRDGPHSNAKLRELERVGAYFDGAMDMLPKDRAAAWKGDFRLAQDAQPTLSTVPNGGIPSWLTMYVDPEVVAVIFSPMRAAEIIGEAKKGDWVTDTATFLFVESTGEVSSYGDYSENGSSGANANFPQRQSYHYQTFTRYGEREVQRAGLTRLDWVGQLNIASALTLNKFQNKSYFFGVSGLQNYGLLNDPSLPAAISPTAAWASSTADVIFEDVRRLFTQAQTQANGTIGHRDAMVLACSPTVETYLLKTNQYNVNVLDQLKKNFPNMRVETAVEYANPTGAGQLVQLIVESVQGQKTAQCAFTEKMRAHAIVRGTSSFKQKKSQGTWGTVVYQPFAIASMVGV